MEEVVFKDFIKRLNKLPLLYKENYEETNASIPILSLPEQNSTVSPISNTNNEEINANVTVKILNGGVLKVPQAGTIKELKRKVSVNGSVRLIHQGKALADDLDLSSLPSEATIQAVISNPITPNNTSNINRDALKRDLTALLLRHGISPVQVESLVASFISQLQQ